MNLTVSYTSVKLIDMMFRASNPDVSNSVIDVARRQWFVFICESQAFWKYFSFCPQDYFFQNHFIILRRSLYLVSAKALQDPDSAY